MNILSLFDGISCGRVALERAGIKVDKYFASEIDKYAIQIAKKNYPDTIHIGDIKNISYEYGCLHQKVDETFFNSWEDTIDMIIGGSPCQDLSIAKKDGKGLQGEKSGLFFEYVRLLKEVKPKYFLLENVASMKKADKEEITRILGVEPVLINSALVSAQNRKRLYWIGQNRKRAYDTDILCKQCFYDTIGNNRRKESSLGRGEEKILGKTQEGQMSMQGMQYGVPKDLAEMNCKNLQCGMYGNKQEADRQNQQTKEQRNNSSTTQGIPKNGTMETMEGEIQKYRTLQGDNEEIRGETGKKSNKKNESGHSPSNNLTEEETIDTGCNKNIKDGGKVCCVRCGKKLIYRPYNTTIPRWNEGTSQFTDSLQELQFTETRQDDGGIFDTYTISIEQPEDKGIVLKDILEEIGYVDRLKSYCIDACYAKFTTLERYFKKGARQIVSLIRIGTFNSGGQGDRIYSPDGKSVSLSANGGVRGAKTGLYEVKEKSNTIRTSGRGSGIDDKHNWDTVYTGSVIRKLTPIECEKLQTLPVNYTEGVSNSQRYKAIGNGWTVDAIAHIFSYIK